ncbi:hypothetical protein G6F43_002252 [Rhizopus delemar]|nr:hypothetical protein G6F43_002252 [Rhizopus delemar]
MEEMVLELEENYRVINNISTAATTILQKEQDHIFVNNCYESVGTLIKNEAVTLCPNYHSLDSDGKAALFPPKTYPVDSYDYIKELLSSLISYYNKHNSKKTSWTNIYKELKRLDNIYDHELDTIHNNTSFCVHFLLHILSIIKHQPHLFREEIDKSEWDFVVDFWCVVTERLFHGSGLRLKWGDTHLTVHDTVSNLLLGDQIFKKLSVFSKLKRG